MKKILLIVWIYLFVISISLGQKNYIGLGDSDKWKVIIKFEVIDSESHYPISNTKIDLYDGHTRLFSIYTDKNGVAVIIIHEWANFPGGQFKVTAQNYRYWEKDVTQWEFYKNRRKNMIVLPDKNTEREVDWTATSCCPDDVEIAQYLSKGKYNIFSGNYTYFAPGLFEYKIELEKIEYNIELENK